MGTETIKSERGRAGRAGSERSMWWFLDTLVIEHELNDARGVFVFEQLLPEGASPPLHVHDGLDDSFYLLEGRMVVRRGDGLFLAGAGSWVSVPACTPHTFRVLDGSARMLLVHDDASYRDLVHDVGTPADRLTLPEQTGGPGLERLSQALVDHDSRVVGPSMSEDEARAFLLGAGVTGAR
jgi:mannose-6-phosphate isomerase-like protein (cupin superfamily)